MLYPKPMTAQFFMKNIRVLMIIFVSILLVLPTAAPRAAASMTLTPGTTTLIGTVDVSQLQETGQSTTNTNQAPLHSQGVQAYVQGKAQVELTGYVPAAEV